MEKYYFVVYKWRNKNIKDWVEANAVMNKHPLVWLREKVDSVEQYRIMFWSEIEEGHYNLVHGWID